jgi:1,2-phenylacetyl-CoA epoxidase PaaB subunit
MTAPLEKHQNNFRRREEVVSITIAVVSNETRVEKKREQVPRPDFNPNDPKNKHTNSVDSREQRQDNSLQSSCRFYLRHLESQTF